jgi:hypothetical protein
VFLGDVFPFDLDFVDLGEERAAVTGFDHHLDFLPLTLQEHFDPAIREISDPTTDRHFLCLSLDKAPETDSLDDT